MCKAEFLAPQRKQPLGVCGPQAIGNGSNSAAIMKGDDAVFQEKSKI